MMISEMWDGDILGICMISEMMRVYQDVWDTFGDMRVSYPRYVGYLWDMQISYPIESESLNCTEAYFSKFGWVCCGGAGFTPTRRSIPRMLTKGTLAFPDVSIL